MVTIPSGYAQVNLMFGGAALPNGAQMTFGVTNSGQDPDETADVVDAAIAASTIRTLYMGSAVINGIRVKNGPNDDGPFTLKTVSYVGTSTAPDPATPQIAILLHKHTLLGGRRGAGRMYLPGIAETAVSHTGAVSSSVLTASNAAWTGFLGELNEGLCPMVVLHSPASHWELNEKGQPVRVEDPGVIPLPSTVTSITTDPQCATQRRRNRS